MITSFVYFCLSLIFIYFDKIKKTKVSSILFLGSTIIFLTFFNSSYDNRFESLIKFINKNKQTNVPARETFVVGDDYSKIGFFVWNRVKKYRWLWNSDNEKEAGLEGILKNPKYKFFVVTKETENSELILKTGKKLNLKLKKFDDVKLLYKN